jgi:hypothetical protein
MSNFNFIVAGRGTGKTRKLLEHAREHDAIVICKHPGAMMRKAEAYGIYGLKFDSYDNAALSLKEFGSMDLPQPFVVDEVKDFIDFITASTCVGFTQTEDD